jgi:hypothetical protein
MNRRDFIKMTSFSTLGASLPSAFKLHAAPADFSGKLLVTLQLEGGWDVSALCDPKMNAPGEAIINTWAQNGETQSAGKIQYAQFANNATFFNKYHRDMMVINGIDSQTNSHSAGVTHNWSGRISAGYPTLTALYAAINAPNLPINYINNGGYAETAGLTRYTRLSDSYAIKNIVKPTETNWNPDEKWIPDADNELVQQLRDKQMIDKLSTAPLSVKEKLVISNYKSSLDNASILTNFADELSAIDSLYEDETGIEYWSSLKRQMQLALISMKAGVSVAADLQFAAFDTHSRHDLLHTEALTHATDSIDFFWQYAEQMGLADRIVLVINSDFSRTPYYNDSNGKDHWPVGSAIIMERDAPWGNRTVGLTDEAQNVVPINPLTLQPQENGGSIIYPKHVMQALREYMGVSDHILTSPFAFNNEHKFDFFNSSLSTPQNSDPRNSIRI